MKHHQFALLSSGAGLLALACTAYLFRRRFVVKPMPCVLASRDELNKLVCNDDIQDLIDITLLDENHLAFEEDQALNSRAFSTYAMCTWWLMGANLSEQSLLSVMTFMGQCVRTICLRRGGFVLCARDRETGQMLASCRVAYYDNNQVDDDNLHVLRGLISGEIGLPWFALTFDSRLFLKRMTRSMSAMEENRQRVVLQRGKPGAAYLYLIHLATDPALQSKGAGTKLLRAIGRIADAFHLPVYLETDSDRLRKFYERNAFEVKIEYTVQDEHAPFAPNFGMLRECNV